MQMVLMDRIMRISRIDINQHTDGRLWKAVFRSQTLYFLRSSLLSLYNPWKLM